MDGAARLAMVETRTVDSAKPIVAPVSIVAGDFMGIDFHCKLTKIDA
jgi:hypothetical protein